MSRYFPEGDDFNRLEIFPGVVANTTPGEHIHLSAVEFADGGIVERHSHPHEQCGVVVRGRARFEIGDEVRDLGPGDLYRIPGGVPHRVVGLEAPALAVDFFFPMRETYLKKT
jgi:quercetin dioxygenase-like cupin family protein